MTRQRDYTVREAADLLGVTASRVRQLCLKLKIGTIRGTSKLLTQSEFRQLKVTRKRNNAESRVA